MIIITQLFITIEHLLGWNFIYLFALRPCFALWSGSVMDNASPSGGGDCEFESRLDRILTFFYGNFWIDRQSNVIDFNPNSFNVDSLVSGDSSLHVVARNGDVKMALNLIEVGIDEQSTSSVYSFTYQLIVLSQIIVWLDCITCCC